MKTLEVALSENKNLLGSNYCNLGKRSEFGPLGGKTFLSYRGAFGWDVVRLNPWQLLARTILGWYKETRLETVIEGWNRYKVGRIEFKPEKYKDLPELEKRLQDLWKKSRGPAEPFPPFALFFGNCDNMKKAQVICFGERHGDKAFRKFTSMIINKLYRPGDIVLVEGRVAGKPVRPKDFPCTQHIRQDVKMQGWEPKIKQIKFSKRDEMRNGLRDKNKAFLAKFPKKIKAEQIDELEKKTKAFFHEELLSFYEFFFPKLELRREALERVERTWSNFFSAVRKKEFNSPINAWKTLFMHFIEELYDRMEKVIYKHITAEESKKIDEEIPIRNDSLCSEMDKHTRSRRRVFIIGGALHFFRSPEGDRDKVVDALKRRNFILATPNRVYKTFISASLNADLQPLKNPNC